jgi:hypothetical protein
MGARSRKRGRAVRAEAPEQPAPPAPPDDDPMRRGYARGRARDDAVRAGLEPLAPGERPRVVTLAAAVALVFAVANVVAAVSGNDLSSATGDPSVTTAITTALLVVAGVGMLARQYWAVLGFQTILGIQIVFFSLYLIGVQRWYDAIVPVVAIGLMGWLFWKLVRAMARLQMPERGPTEPTR